MPGAEQTDAGEAEIPSRFSSDIGQGALREFDFAQQPGIKRTQRGEESIKQSRCSIHGWATHLAGQVIQQRALLFTEITESLNGTGFLPPQSINAGVSRKPRCPMLQRRITAIAGELLEDLEEDVLHEVFAVLTQRGVGVNNPAEVRPETSHEHTRRRFITLLHARDEFAEFVMGVGHSLAKMPASRCDEKEGFTARPSAF